MVVGVDKETEAVGVEVAQEDQVAAVEVHQVCFTKGVDQAILTTKSIGLSYC